MRKRFIKLTDLLMGIQMILLGLTAFTGLQACSDSEEEDLPFVAVSDGFSYQVTGKVTDEHGKPIRGIKVKIESQWFTEEWLDEEGMMQYRLESVSGRDSTFTDKKGRYQSAVNWQGTYVYGGRSELKLVLTDEDGNANGSFESVTLPLDDFPCQEVVKRVDNTLRDVLDITADITLKKKGNP